jgi:hypothetical protein
VEVEEIEAKRDSSTAQADPSQERWGRKSRPATLEMTVTAEAKGKQAGKIKGARHGRRAFGFREFATGSRDGVPGVSPTAIDGFTGLA